MTKINIGCHVSMNKQNDFLIGTVNEAVSYGCETFMFYTGAPQNTIRTDINNLHVDEFKILLQKNNLNRTKIVVHAPYIINLANTINKETWNFGVEFLKKEVKRCEMIGIELLVLHPGSRLTGDLIESLDKLIIGLQEVLAETQGVKICLETMAGKGSEVGTTLEDLAYVVNALNSPRIGICIDTCHMNDAGYEMNEFDNILTKIDSLMGIEKVLVVHLNDSKNPKGSKKDRHENIGYGSIGFDTLLKIAYNSKILEIPKILETPYVDKTPPYQMEIYNIKNKQFLQKIK